MAAHGPRKSYARQCGHLSSVVGKGAIEMGAVLGILVVIIFALLVLSASACVRSSSTSGGWCCASEADADHPGAGAAAIVPFADKMTKVSLQTVVLDIPAQSAITRDNVSIGVDAVVYFRVEDPVRP